MIFATDSFFLLFQRIMLKYITREVTEEMNFIDHAISEITNGEDFVQANNGRKETAFSVVFVCESWRNPFEQSYLQSAAFGVIPIRLLDRLVLEAR